MNKTTLRLIMFVLLCLVPATGSVAPMMKKWKKDIQTWRGKRQIETRRKRRLKQDVQTYEISTQNLLREFERLTNRATEKQAEIEREFDRLGLLRNTFKEYWLDGIKQKRDGTKNN